MSNIKIDVDKFNMSVKILKRNHSSISNSAMNIKNIDTTIDSSWTGSSANSFDKKNQEVYKNLKVISSNINELSKSLEKICRTFGQVDEELSTQIRK